MIPAPLEKLRELERSMSKAKGHFELFGIFLRDNSMGLWDLLVAAPWLDPDKLESFKWVAAQLQARLTHEEFLRFSRIAILEKGDPFLEILLSRVKVAQGLEPFELRNFSVSDILIRRAYLITSMRPNAQKRRSTRSTGRTR